MCAPWVSSSHDNTRNSLELNHLAGVSHGPFPEFRSRLLAGGSAGELFDFADPESVVSKRYEDSLRIALQYGVRITYCASIDDQLISMEVRQSDLVLRGCLPLTRNPVCNIFDR